MALLLVLIALTALTGSRAASNSFYIDEPIQGFGNAVVSPSSADEKLVGPVTLLKSATVDLAAGTATVPLYRGTLKGRPGYNVWYIVTDTDDADTAASLGLNFSPKLKYSSPGARTASFDANHLLAFDNGTVDFTPAHSITAGKAPNYFPPTSFKAGSLGDAYYTPPVVVLNEGGHVYNAPIIAGNVAPAALAKYCHGVPAAGASKAYAILHDKVTAICPSADGNGGTVTLGLVPGFSWGKLVGYYSTEADVELTAALEGVTYAPAFVAQDVGRGDDDYLGSPITRLFTITNGFNNGDINPKHLRGRSETAHPLRQGLGSVLRGDKGGGPLNILSGIPTVTNTYSPFWDVNLGEWTQYAVESNYRTRNKDAAQYLGFVEQGYIVSPGGGPIGAFPAGIVNCPIVNRYE